MEESKSREEFCEADVFGDGEFVWRVRVYWSGNLLPEYTKIFDAKIDAMKYVVTMETARVKVDGWDRFVDAKIDKWYGD